MRMRTMLSSALAAVAVAAAVVAAQAPAAAATLPTWNRWAPCESRGRGMTGKEIVRLRDVYQKLFSTMIGYLNKGFGPEDAVRENPLKPYEGEFGKAAQFEHDALRSMLIAYVPD